MKLVKVNKSLILEMASHIGHGTIDKNIPGTGPARTDQAGHLISGRQDVQKFSSAINKINESNGSLEKRYQENPSHENRSNRTLVGKDILDKTKEYRNFKNNEVLTAAQTGTRIGSTSSPIETSHNTPQQMVKNISSNPRAISVKPSAMAQSLVQNRNR